jgi:erythromycin esterase
MTRRLRRPFALLPLTLTLARCGSGGTATGGSPGVASAQVTAFLRDRAVPFDTDDPTHANADLQPFEAMVGSARVVSLGEGTHGTAEFFRMKHRLLRVLVEEMGFTAFGIEASFPDSEPINDYVLHGRGDARRALAGQGFWTWRTEEVLAMVEWMRAYNAAHGPVLSFRGFDMQHPLTAMDLVIAYLQRVDRAAAAQAEQLYAPYRPYADWPTVGNYRTAPADIRAPIRAGVAEVADMLNRERTRYEAASSARAFADASRHARTVVQAEALYSGTGDRDAFMAENALWLLDQAGPGARIVLWAHNGHVQRAPDNFASMGAALDRVLGTQMLVVGFAFGQGTCTAVSNATGPHHPHRPRAHLRQLRGRIRRHRAAALPARHAWLSRGAPGPDWFLGAHSHRNIGAVYDASRATQYFQPAQLARLYEVVVYFEDTNASRVYSVPTASSAEASAMR